MDRSMRAPAFHTCPSQKCGPLLTRPAEDVKSVSGLHRLTSKVLTTRCGLKTEWQSWSPPRLLGRPWGEALEKGCVARAGDLERWGHEGLRVNPSLSKMGSFSRPTFLGWARGQL